MHSASNDKEWIFEELGMITYPIYDTQEAYSRIHKEPKDNDEVNGKTKDEAFNTVPQNTQTKLIIIPSESEKQANRRNKKEKKKEMVKKAISNKNEKLVNSTNNNNPANAGLELLLSTLLNIQISKETKKQFQLTNWSKRPLSKDELNYSCFDSAFLLALKGRLDSIKPQNIKEFKINNQEKQRGDAKDRVFIKATVYFEKNQSQFTENSESLREAFLRIVSLVDKHCYLKNISLDSFFSVKNIYKLIWSVGKDKNRVNVQSFLKQGDYSNTNNNGGFSEEKELCNKVDTVIKDYYNQVQISKSSMISEVIEIDSISSKHGFNSNSNINQKVKKSPFHTIARKAPVYENCKMISQEGELLAMTDKKRMTWYLTRGLAKELSPDSFQLNFVQRGFQCKVPDKQSADFYVSKRENLCVVCGDYRNYCKFHVIPVNYRHFLPKELKSHLSHDVILLCVDCHSNANRVFDKKIKEVAALYEVPLFVPDKEGEEGRKITSILSLCRKIIKEKVKMPIEVRVRMVREVIEFLVLNIEEEEFKEVIKSICVNDIEEGEKEKEEGISTEKTQFYLVKLNKDLGGVDNKVDMEEFNGNSKQTDYNEAALKESSLLIERFVKIQQKTGILKKKNIHGKVLLDKVENKEEFIKLWREFFVSSMKPEFLPDYWDVNHQY
eukprot:CAMPEP_0170538752 /NCGR_PEP_ID=MMETSP0209-20121228/103504_1 /TAXON_ID=665100 ORGANISM="Litonotus pictus, Strain P1" /NCGR_SAMPLE_ID=MMETSP0209 /ASSEMBLY_ACC=CAM_ASM_000301 /LENGTH=666 /DNA_ID=CAMNT_0010840517 /DNA_START=675 /DNA_END=2672 /DNA_ORIENTATION=-